MQKYVGFILTPLTLLCFTTKYFFTLWEIITISLIPAYKTQVVAKGRDINMEIDAIKKLIETDEKTRAEVQAQYQKRTDLKKQIEEQKKQISKETWDAVNAQVANTKKELDAKIADNAAKNQEYYEKSLKELQAAYDKNKETWKKEIVVRIIHGE
mgnify:CR=1 FL=1